MIHGLLVEIQEGEHARGETRRRPVNRAQAEALRGESKGAEVTHKRKAIPFWVTAAVFLVGMAGGTLPSPLYPLYQAHWGFSNTTVTVIFAVYAAGVLTALIGLGRASDAAGRRPVLLLSVALATVSTLLFLIARGLVWLLVGRFLSGLAVGALTGTATAALIELEPTGNKLRASRVAAVVNPAGLGAGTLAAGTLAQFAPAPLRTVYAVYLGVLAALIVGILFIPETVIQTTQSLGLRMQRPRVPREIRAEFVTAALGGSCALVVQGLFSGLAPSFLHEVLHDRNIFVAGLLVAVLFSATTVAPLAAARLSRVRANSLGTAALIVGLVLVLIGLGSASLTAFFVGALIVGLGTGSIFVSSLALINRCAPAEHRGEVISAFFVAAYTALTLPVIGVGIASAHIGILMSTEVLSTGVVVLAVATLMRIRRSAKMEGEDS